MAVTKVLPEFVIRWLVIASTCTNRIFTLILAYSILQRINLNNFSDNIIMVIVYLVPGYLLSYASYKFSKSKKIPPLKEFQVVTLCNSIIIFCMAIFESEALMIICALFLGTFSPEHINSIILFVSSDDQLYTPQTKFYRLLIAQYLTGILIPIFFSQLEVHQFLLIIAGINVLLWMLSFPYVWSICKMTHSHDPDSMEELKKLKDPVFVILDEHKEEKESEADTSAQPICEPSAIAVDEEKSPRKIISNNIDEDKLEQTWILYMRTICFSAFSASLMEGGVITYAFLFFEENEYPDWRIILILGLGSFLAFLSILLFSEKLSFDRMEKIWVVSIIYYLLAGFVAVFEIDMTILFDVVFICSHILIAFCTAFPRINLFDSCKEKYSYKRLYNNMYQIMTYLGRASGILLIFLIYSSERLSPFFLIGMICAGSFVYSFSTKVFYSELHRQATENGEIENIT